MTQLSGNQFEDDLTVGADEGDSFSTDSMDLFEVPGDEDSPIAKLKAIILSIDWEINNEILQQLEDELVDLQDIWSGDKIKLIYVQGLSKIGKYIFKEKASAHPDAIKLLITFYHNLEQIVSASDGSMSDDEKKKLLLADVKKFDRLKGEIAQAEAASPSQESQTSAPASSSDTEKGPDELKALKAQVLGIDWEINDQELQKLGDEVKRLMAVFKNDKAKLVLLQGIGALSAYINKMRSKSNSNVFTLLRSFCDTLEKVSGTELSADESKELLLSEVAKFKEFKADIAKGPADDGPATVAADSPASLAPAAVSDESEDETVEEEPGDDAIEADVSSRLSSVFGDDETEEIPLTDVEESSALEGVNVETEADDDSDEDALPYEDGGIAPALADAEEDSSFSVEKLAGDLAVAAPSAAPEPIVGDDLFGDDDEEDAELPGIDVESEADDDSEEDALPTEDGALAPALSGADDEAGFNAEGLASEIEGEESDDIENRLGSFFDDEVETSSAGWESEADEPAPALTDEEEETEIPGVDVESEADDDSEEDALPTEGGELAPALSGSGDETGFDEGERGSDIEGTDSDAIESRLGSFFDDEVEIASAGWATESEEPDVADDKDHEDDGVTPALSDTPADDDIETSEDDVQEDIQDESPVALDFDEALEEEPASPALLDAEESEQDDVSVDEPVEESVEEELSFLDEEDQTDDLFADTEMEVTESEKEAEGDTEEALEFEEESAEDQTDDLFAGIEAEEAESEEETGDDLEEALEFEAESTEDQTDDLFAGAETEEDEGEGEEETEDDAEEALEFEEENVEDQTEELFADAETEEAESEEEAEDDTEEALEFEEESIEDQTEELFTDTETEEIESGEEATEEAFELEDTEQVAEEDDDSAFTVPGEALATAAVTAVAAAGVVGAMSNHDEDDDTLEFENPDSFVDEDEQEEIIFEAVDDDVELDLLPGEEYVDSESSDDLIAFAGDETDNDEAIIFAADGESEEESANVNRYESLSIMASAIQQNVTEEAVQDILDEMNRLRSLEDTDHTEKMFMQLLSTTCQNVQSSSDTGSYLFLIEGITSGLVKGDAGDVAPELIQTELLQCTSQLLLLQQRQMNASLHQQTEPAPLAEDVSEPQADSFQHELADLRKLFVDEIGALRKELTEK